MAISDLSTAIFPPDSTTESNPPLIFPEIGLFLGDLLLIPAGGTSPQGLFLCVLGGDRL